MNFHCDFLHFTTDKIKKRYGNLGQVLCHTIDRGHSSNIGISLAGHRDRNKMACFIAGINPKGVASSGGLEIGDEILEVSMKQKKRRITIIKFIFIGQRYCIAWTMPLECVSNN